MWEDNPQLNALVDALNRTPVQHFLRNFYDDHSALLVALQTTHILGIAMMVATAWLTGAWLMGATALPRALAASPRVLIRARYVALAVLATTGLVLILRWPERILLSNAFPIKMTLVALGLAMMLRLAGSLKDDALYWERTAGRRAAGRALGLSILLVWSAVVFAGRWIPFS